MADKAGDMLPMDRFDSDFHGAADIPVNPDNYAPLRSLADIERMERVPFELRARPLSSFGLIRRGARLDLGKTALHVLRDGDPERAIARVSHEDFLGGVIRAANLFRSLGVGVDDAVVLMLPNLAETHYALWGAQVAGIAFSVNWMLEPSQLNQLVRSAGARVLVALGPADGFEIWDKARRITEQSDQIEHLLQVTCLGDAAPDAPDFGAALAEQPGALTYTRNIKPDDTAIYLHTGGTTGAPKIARLKHRGMAYQRWANSAMKGMTRNDVVFGAGPLFHAGGICVDSLPCFANGMTMVIPDPSGFRNKAVIRNYWKLVEHFGITFLNGVPTGQTALMQNPPKGEDISSLRPFGGSGSGALPAELGRRIEEVTGVRVLVTYGATEFTCNISMAPRDGDPRFGSSGIRWPYTQIRTVQLDAGGNNTRDCAVDEIGAIVVKGPSIIAGYLSAADTASLFTGDGWLNNGDLGRIDGDDYLWVTGRAKDVIIRGGHNIDPRVIEETLLGHDGVALAAAVGKPDAYACELPVAYIQLAPGNDATVQAIADYVRRHIPERAANPVDIHVLEALPQTAVGKIYKPALRQDAARRAFQAALEPLAAAIEVAVASHPVHGTLATVTVNSSERARLEAEIGAILGAYPIAHENVWTN
jgi:fatty-acyl-CoA synthase